jgi:ParB family transcriptional regulator, chromosome partitioning protein
MSPNGKSSIGTIKEIPLDKIDIGTAQVRTDLTSGIEDLAASIRKQGLLEPIVVASGDDGTFEILAGQRRFLAHHHLKYEKIRAVVVDGSNIDDYDKLSISLTENLVRRDNTKKELIDACTKLHKRYGSVKMVAEETGLSPTVVSQYVKYESLVEPLRKLVDEAKLDMKVALQAQSAASNADGSVDQDAAEKFATELAPMSNTQRKQFVKGAKSDPKASVEEKIERGRQQPVLRQIVVTLETEMHNGLQEFAKDEGVNQDEAAANLIEDGLVRRGFGGE